MAGAPALRSWSARNTRDAACGGFVEVETNRGRCESQETLRRQHTIHTRRSGALLAQATRANPIEDAGTEACSWTLKFTRFIVIHKEWQRSTWLETLSGNVLAIT